MSSDGQVKLNDQPIRGGRDMAYEVGVEQESIGLGGTRSRSSIASPICAVRRQAVGRSFITTPTIFSMVDVVKRLQAKKKSPTVASTIWRAPECT